MKLNLLVVILCLSYAGLSHAEIYKRVDAKGHVTYSSEPLKGGRIIDLKPLASMPGSRASQRSTPEDFPKVDNQTQKRRDVTRRMILEDELATEEKLLATAQGNLKNLESSPESSTGPDGVPFRNSAKYQEQAKAAQDLIALHEQNIKALRTEISNLK